MSETIFVFLIILSVLVWLNSLTHSSVKGYALLGILLGLANLTRPTAVLLPALIILFILLFDRQKFILKSISLLFFFSLVSSPLVITNYLRYHNFSPVALGGGPSLWINSKNWDSRIEYDEKGNYAGVYKEFLEVGQGLSPVEKEKKYRQEAFKNISQHPFKYIGAFSSKLFRLYARPAGYEQLGGRGENIFKKFCFVLFYGLILICCLFGTVFILINRNKRALVCLSFIIYFSIIHMLTNPNDTRYHLPAMPFAIILATYGFFSLKRLIFSLKRV
jgi:4-amino-4-deoxy-L-arabinose transferase-like glycosyltransferase